MKPEGFIIAKTFEGAVVGLLRGAITQKFAFIGKSGSGKTYGAGKLIEEFYDRGLQVIIVDPVGNWSGIRAPGTGPGLEIPVLGGLHGDLPLHPDSGEAVAAHLVKYKMSAVVDVSQFKGAEQRRFVEAFATSFFENKKRHKSPVMIFWEECQVFIPQKVMPDQTRMVGALENLIKIGRNYGVGTSLLSQRPQSVNKDVLNLTECFICFQLTAPHERKAVGEWMSYSGVGLGKKSESDMDLIPELQPGEAFIWSPSWLRMRQRVKFLPKRSSDFSKTPDFEDSFDEIAIAPIQTISKSMLDELRTVIEAREMEDVVIGKGVPKALKKRMKELESALAEANQTVLALQGREIAPAVQKVYVPVISSDEFQRIGAFVSLMENRITDLVTMGTLLGNQLKSSISKTGQVSIDTETTGNPPLPPAVQALTDIVKRENKKIAEQEDKAKSGFGAVAAMMPQTSPLGSTLIRGEWAIVQVAAANYPNACSLEYLAVATCFALAGGFRNYITKLKNEGYLEKGMSSGGYTATEKAMALFRGRGREKPLAPKPRQILEMWTEKKLTGKEKNILRAFFEADGASISLEKMAALVGMQLAGGFRNYITALKNYHLITKGIGGYRISEHLQTS